MTLHQLKHQLQIDLENLLQTYQASVDKPVSPQAQERITRLRTIVHHESSPVWRITLQLKQYVQQWPTLWLRRAPLKEAMQTMLSQPRYQTTHVLDVQAHTLTRLQRARADIEETSLATQTPTAHQQLTKLIGTVIEYYKITNPSISDRRERDIQAIQQALSDPHEPVWRTALRLQRICNQLQTGLLGQSDLRTRVLEVLKSRCFHPRVLLQQQQETIDALQAAHSKASIDNTQVNAPKPEKGYKALRVPLPSHLKMMSVFANAQELESKQAPAQTVDRPLVSYAGVRR
jgi:hypothetical protein